MAKKLMVVDDNELIRGMAALILKKAGYTVVEAANGLDALNKLDGSEVDMVITDLRMPLMDGLEFINQLRTVPAYRYLPIAVMSADFQECMRGEVEKAGVSDWISKPFLRHQLIDAVDRSVMRAM
jgi:two-component system chemotaxis response regulator CheY